VLISFFYLTSLPGFLSASSPGSNGGGDATRRLFYCSFFNNSLFLDSSRKKKHNPAGFFLLPQKQIRICGAAGSSRFPGMFLELEKILVCMQL